MKQNFAPDMWMVSKVSGKTIWRKLPWAVLSAVPLAISWYATVILWAMESALWTLVAVFCVVPAMVLQGFFGVALRADRSLWGVHISATLMGIVIVWGAVAGFLALQDNPLRWVGYLALAVLILVSPIAVAYSGIRGTGGFRALRAGFILAAVSPSSSVSLLGVTVLGYFLAAATTGTALLVTGPCISVFAAVIVDEVVRKVNGETPIK